jgi:hydroxymethylpyrimidine/phosphomethylpyrimidine kinase
MKVALTIAGSDSSGGAGVQADVKAIASLGVHPCTVVICITSQNTKDVDSIFPLPAIEIGKQLGSVLEDIEVNAVKTGMLYSAEIVEVMANSIEKSNLPLVVDPVMISTTQNSLQSDDLIEALKSRLLPICEVVTPNTMEAEALSGMTIEEDGDIESACKEIQRLGAKNVLIKGGHLEGDPVDVLLSDGKFERFGGERFEEDVHGSGCAFSAFITANLALGNDLVESIRRSKQMITAGFFNSYKIGKGVPIIQSHYEEDRYSVWKKLDLTLEDLMSILPPELVPEVGINIGYALPFATAIEDVAGLEGRIIKVGDGIDTLAHIDFGASKHVARIILTAMRYDHRFRSAMNLKFSETLVDRFKGLGYSVAEFDRSGEPKGVSTMEWGTENAIRVRGSVPDVIFDRGSVGKEPMVRLLGESPSAVAEKLRAVVAR